VCNLVFCAISVQYNSQLRSSSCRDPCTETRRASRLPSCSTPSTGKNILQVVTLEVTYIAMNVHVTVSSCADFDICYKWRIGVGDICTNILGLLQEVMTLEMCQTLFTLIIDVSLGHAVAQFVEALRYKPEGRGFDSRCCYWKFFIDIILLAAMWSSGTGGRHIGLTTLPFSFTDCPEI